jgi:hypothetical protein
MLIVIGAVVSVGGGQSAAAGVPAPSAFVRVNQVGYGAQAPKQAYLMASLPETGARFTVVDGRGHAVFSGLVSDRTGSWSAHYPDVYALDFTVAHRTGAFTIDVAGPVPATSPTFRITRAGKLYGPALDNSLSFYQNERDGPDFIASSLRTAPGHVNDVHAMTYVTPKVDANGNFKGDLDPTGVTIDASGGWWDAGDYLKFVQTTSFTVDMMLVGVRDFPDQMGSGSTSDFTAEAKFGLDWLQKMWDDSTGTLYYQVGIGGDNAHTVSDHDIWRLPQADDTYGGTDPVDRYIRQRPVFRAGPPGALISPNLAGRLAADFALCAQVFRKSDPAYAATCLASGEHVFALADTHPTGPLLTAIPYGFYPESSWQDDLELGATELATALRDGATAPGLVHRNSGYYLRRAASWAHRYITGPHSVDTLNLYDVSGLAHYELSRAIDAAGKPPNLAVTRSALRADLRKQLDSAVSVSDKDPFRFGVPWATYDTVSHGAGLSVMASEYDALTHSDVYASYGIGWLDDILGADPWGSSFVVGDGTVFPDCMQHQVANIAGSLDGSAPILAGAVVEGPNSFAARGNLPNMRPCPATGGDVFAQFNGHSAVYQDNVQSYSTVEPAIDLGATTPLAMSWLSTG